jgi:CheY-like chemotaxis protein
VARRVIALSPRAKEITPPPELSLSILVIENHEDSAASLADLLQFCGYRVVATGSGEAALQCAEPLPDIVITELRLPDMDGHELVSQFRKKAAANKPLFVVALTTGGSPDERRRANQSGVDLYLLKPADPKVLLAALAGFCHSLTPKQ